MVNGLADAMKDRVPVLAITGQVESYFMGTGHKQYINLQKMLGAVTLRLRTASQVVCRRSADLLRTAVSQQGQSISAFQGLLAEGSRLG